MINRYFEPMPLVSRLNFAFMSFVNDKICRCQVIHARKDDSECRHCCNRQNLTHWYIELSTGVEVPTEHIAKRSMEGKFIYHG